LLSIAACAWWLLPTDARRIRAACHELADRVSAPASEPDLARLARAAQIARHLALDVVIEVEGSDLRIEGRNAVVSYAGRMRSGLDRRVTLGEIEITIDGRSASAETTATAQESGPGDGPARVDVRNLVMTWVRTEDGWQMSHLRVGRAPAL
jgi:hypothetical protein